MQLNSKTNTWKLDAKKATLTAKFGVLLIIAVMVSGCAFFKPKYKAEPQPKQVTTRTKEVCDVPLSYRFLTDAPAKPVAKGGKQFPSNEQIDLYWKTDVQVTQICELVCKIRDILFICTYGQDKLENPPKQCLGEDGLLSCK